VKLAAISWSDAAAVPVVVVAVLSSIVAAELLSYGTTTALWLVRTAAAVLPAAQRDRFREEWTEHVLTKSANGEHNLTALIWALGIVVSAVRLSRPGHHVLSWTRMELDSTGNGPVLAFAVGIGIASSVGPTTTGLLLGATSGSGLLVVLCCMTWVGRRHRPSGYVASKGYVGCLSSALMLAAGATIGVAWGDAVNAVAGGRIGAVASGIVLGWLGWSLLRPADAILTMITAALTINTIGDIDSALLVLLGTTVSPAARYVSWLSDPRRQPG